MKATAKHDCSVTLTTDMDSLSLNRVPILKGQVLDLPVYRDELVKNKQIAEAIGERAVAFKYDFMLMLTYSKDFDYSE